ncbi:hypothetical protein M758_2G201600 [Ceratodon purpureus]|nr:hypothetical protein M758_2G201600 [Ceratodon purpureus]
MMNHATFPPDDASRTIKDHQRPSKTIKNHQPSTQTMHQGSRSCIADPPTGPTRASSHIPSISLPLAHQTAKRCQCSKRWEPNTLSVGLLPIPHPIHSLHSP